MICGGGEVLEEPLGVGSACDDAEQCDYNNIALFSVRKVLWSAMACCSVLRKAE